MSSAVPEQQLEVVDDLINPAPAPEENEEIVDLNAPAEPEVAAPAAPVAPVAPAAEDDLPLELKGKSPKELAKMYRDAQQLIGRQGTELGDLRKRADQFITAALAGRQQVAPTAPAAPAAPAVPATIDESEFFAKPNEAIAKAIAASPVIQEIRKSLGDAAQAQAIARAEAATARFNASHPDAGEIMNDPEFRTWVQASRVRQQLLARAHNAFDFDAGDEVFGTWKALKSVKAPAAAPAAAATPDDAAARAAAQTLAARAAAVKKQAANAAATPTGGNASPAAPGGAKKIYRRADVLKLMENDRDRYEQLADEIALAYAEDRVR